MSRKIESIDQHTEPRNKDFFIRHVAEGEAEFYIHLRPPSTEVFLYSGPGETSIKLQGASIGYAFDMSRLRPGTRTVLYCLRVTARYQTPGQETTVPTHLVTISDVVEVNSQSVHDMPFLKRIECLKQSVNVRPHTPVPVTVQMAQYRPSKALSEVVKHITPRLDFRHGVDAMFHTIKGCVGESWTVKTQGCMFVFKDAPFSTPALFWDSVDNPDVPVESIMRLTTVPTVSPPITTTKTASTRDPRMRQQQQQQPPPLTVPPVNAQAIDDQSRVQLMSTLLRAVMPVLSSHV